MASRRSGTCAPTGRGPAGGPTQGGDDDVFALVGSVINGKISVAECVGEGGFAVVYRGYHLAFEQPVAIKCLKLPPMFDAETRSAFTRKLLEEGKMLYRLSQHTSVVRVLDIDEVETARARVPYLELEWLDGINLDAMVCNRVNDGLPPLTESEVLALLRPAVDAIALAHRLGIAHRDVKPSNLMLANTVQGEVLKVLDFGIAKIVEEGEAGSGKATYTSSGWHAFSPRYGAPEQFHSRRFGATGPWTDVHGLGLIMTELLTGRPALVGSDHADFYEQAVADSRPTPRACGATVSDGFEALCARCLAREPEARFRDADELLAAMDALQMGLHSKLMARTSSVPSSSEARFDRPASQSELADTEILRPTRVMHSDPPVAYEPRPAYTTVGDKSLLSRWPLFAAGLVLTAAVVGVVSWPSLAPEPSGAVARVPGGVFLMGSDESAADQRPEHAASVGPFDLDRTEVTVQAFARCVDAGACVATDDVHLTHVPASEKAAWDSFCNWGRPERELHPMNCVDWNQAQAFCAWAGKRLPTEAEWEFAASGGGEERSHPWGDAPLGDVAFNGCGPECVAMAADHGWSWKPLRHRRDPWPTTAPVGSFPESAGRWDHQDLAGNVWEWTASPYHAYGDADSEEVDLDLKVARGGGWASRYPGIFLSTFRTKFPPDYRAQDVGFRCAR